MSVGQQGLRQSKTVDGVTTSFVLDGMYVAAETNGETSTYYSRGVNLISRSTGESKDYYYMNSHGDVTKLVNGSGTVVADYTYDAFGNQTRETEDSNPFRYAGEYWDSESGLIYLRARYYDSGVGIFTSEDLHWNPLNMIYDDETITKTFPAKTGDLIDMIKKQMVINHMKTEIMRVPVITNKKITEIQRLKLGQFTNEENVFIKDAISRINIVNSTSIMQSNNLYSYCLNNPIYWLDPTGETVQFAGATVAAGVGVYIAGNALLVWDDEGNMGIMLGGNIGGGATTAGFGGTIGVFKNLDNIYQLEGLGVSAGVAAGLGFEYQSSSGENGIALTTGLGYSGTASFGWIV